MRNRVVILSAVRWLVVIAILNPSHAAGQASGTGRGAKPASAKRSVMPRTPHGRPDLQGIWDFRTATPLERPREFAEQEFLTDQNAAEVEKRAEERLRVFSPDALLMNTPPWWLDSGTRVVNTKRSSLIVDPRDGRVPPMTEDGLKLQANVQAARKSVVGPESLSPWSRCITRGLPGAMLPGAYNNNLQIVQTSSYVVIITEMIHEARIVPIDVPGRLPETLRAWTGYSRGRWESDTLVIETTNFFERTDFGVGGRNLRLVERFTRIGDGTIEYRFTVEDLTTWIKPWTVAFPLAKSDSPMYEYACHEANYSLGNILSIARAQEAAAAARRQ